MISTYITNKFSLWMKWTFVFWQTALFLAAIAAVHVIMSVGPSQGCNKYFSFCELRFETENFLWKSVTFGTENLVSCRNIWLFLQQMNKLRKFCPKMSSGIEFQNSHVKTFGNWWYSVNIFCETSWFQIFSANLVRRFGWFLHLWYLFPKAVSKVSPSSYWYCVSFF